MPFGSVKESLHVDALCSCAALRRRELQRRRRRDAVWNVNACGRRRGGAPQLQGAGWCCVAKRTRVHDAAPGTLTGAVHAAEVDAIARFAAGGEDGDGEWDGEAVVYAHGAGELVRLPRGAAVPVTLCPLEYELFHLRPPRRAPGGVAFAHVAMPPRLAGRCVSSGGGLSDGGWRDGGVGDDGGGGGGGAAAGGWNRLLAAPARAVKHPHRVDAEVGFSEGAVLVDAAETALVRVVYSVQQRRAVAWKRNGCQDVHCSASLAARVQLLHFDAIPTHACHYHLH
ncbi:hypothetical protein SETIT_3G387000v2 [Setaria italica]|uniref:Uncharacterized protein n=1 Tax=Setaria italica TaxID=4555 RepID=K3ZDF3_SETIT|nr:hypothetical protein SETIT_3G387000v2 [Setaria italica]